MTTDRPLPLVPKLRFREFNNLSGWEPVHLSDVLNYEQPSKYIIKDISYQNTGTPVLTANKSFILGYTRELEGIYYDVPVIIFDDFTTDIKYVNFSFKVKSSAIKILKSRNDDELRLIYELMSRITFDPTQHKRYFISEYQHLKIPLPSKFEQKKIADFLCVLDDLIEAEGRKLEALRQHKQGLMQQLFPQPGKTVPKLRFPKFRDTGAWVIKILGNQGRFLFSLTGKMANDFDTGNAVFIPYMNVFLNTFTNIFDLRSVNVGSHESQNAVAKGDVFFTISSETAEEAGMSSILLEEVENCYLNSFCVLFRFDAGKSPNPVFLGYLLRSELPRARLSRDAQGATRYNISKATFRRLPLQIPSQSEQKKIAGCLRSLDDLIEAEGQKIETLRQHKQGLMQQVFPFGE